MAYAATAANDAEQRALAEAEAKEKEGAEARARATAAAAAEAAARAKASSETDADAKAKAENEAKLQAAAKAKAEADAAAAAKAADASRRAAAMVAKPAPAPVAPTKPVPQPVPTAPSDPKPAPTPSWPPPTPKPQPSEPGELTCGQCGTGNPSSRTFCRQCGAQLGAAAPAPVAPPAPKRSGGLLAKLKGPLIILAVIAVVGGAAFFLSRGGGGGGGDGGSSDGSASETTVDGTQTEPTTQQVTVDATRSFVDTGVTLAAGDEVEIVATGRAFHGGNGGSSGPEGDSDPGLQQFNVIADANHAALIGKIGPSGSVFLVGAKLNFTADKDGPLILGVNDTGVNNNSGGYAVTIKIGGGG
jgi:hypothetical protein